MPSAPSSTSISEPIDLDNSHPPIITCFRSVIDSQTHLITLLLISIIISIGTLYYMFYIRRLIDQSGDREEDLHEKTVVITGANDGIGARVAKELAARGARIVLLCRDVEKARLVTEAILAENPCADLIVHHIDLSSMTSVRICANEILNLERRIDVLINCASVAYVPGNEPTKSIDGYELHMAINYYGHFLLASLLHDRMTQTAKQFATYAKVINVSSIVHQCGDIYLPDLNLDKSYTPLKAYTQSKLALVLATRMLARQWRQDRVHVYSVEPGLTVTASHYQNLYRSCKYLLATFGFFIGFGTIQAAAERIVHCAVDRQVAKQNGYHYRNRRIVHLKKRFCDEKLSQALWTHTLIVCNL